MSALDKAGDLTVSAIGNAAGTVVAPKTGLANLVTKVRSPVGLLALALGGALYLLSRRSRS